MFIKSYSPNANIIRPNLHFVVNNSYIDLPMTPAIRHGVTKDHVMPTVRESKETGNQSNINRQIKVLCPNNLYSAD